MTSGLDDVHSDWDAPTKTLPKPAWSIRADASTRWAYHTGAYRRSAVTTQAGQNYNIITNNWIKVRTGLVPTVYYSKARDMARFGLLALNKRHMGAGHTDEGFPLFSKPW